MDKILQRCLLIGLLIGAGIVGVPDPARAANPFARPGGDPATAAGPIKPNVAKPGVAQQVFTTIAAYQRAFNRDLRRHIRAARTGGSRSPIFALLGLCFLYGIFHAAGPGHGKMVTTTYFLTRKSDWRAGAMMGGAIAAIQAFSALLIIGVLALMLDFSARWITRQAIWIEMTSYALVLGRDACGHRLGEAHDCCRHPHNHTVPERFDRKELRHVVLTAAAVGLRPCTGALLLLLFTFANGLVWVGVAGTFAMAFGVAITVTLIGTGAIGLRAGAARLIPTVSASFRTQQLLATLGAFLIIGLAVLLISGATQRIGGGL